MIPTYRLCLLRSLFGGAEHLAICGLPPPQRCYLFLLALAVLTASERGGGGGTLCEVSGKDYMWQIWRGENQEKTNRQLNARECLGAQMGRRGGDKCRWRGHDRRAAMAAAAADLRTRRPTGGLDRFYRNSAALMSRINRKWASWGRVVAITSSTPPIHTHTHTHRLSTGSSLMFPSFHPTVTSGFDQALISPCHAWRTLRSNQGCHGRVGCPRNFSCCTGPLTEEHLVLTRTQTSYIRAWAVTQKRKNK